MKFKSISKFLTIGILLNSFNLTSFAGILSEDGRYEAFEGSHITINNILEEDKVDVEIEGNTLVNILNDDYYISNYSSYNDGVYTLEQKSSDTNIALNKKNIPYKPDTVYTLIVDIKENTLANTGSENVATITSDGLGEGAYALDTGHINIKYNETGIKKIKATTRYVNGPIFTHMLVHKNTNTPGGNIKFSWMLLEGDWTDKEIPDYFEGMKSIGELDNNTEIISQNKNLWDGTYEIGSIYTEGAGTGGDSTNGTNRKRSYYIPVKPNTTYTISQKDFSNLEHDQIFIHQYDKNKQNILWDEGLSYRGVKESLTITTNSNAHYLRFRTEDNRELYSDTVMIEEGSIATSIISSESVKKDVNLSESLKKANDNTKDRIIKKNGQWYIERNCEEIILNGNENWSIGTESNGWTIYDDSIVVYTDTYLPKANSRFICDKLPYITGSGVCSQNVAGTSNQSWGSVGHISIRLPHSYLTTLDLNGFKQWLKENPLKIVYQLETPIYESIEFDSLPLYLDTTYISTNSTIPANIKVTVDRVLNRAVEAIELAKTTPSVENIAIARMWTNLARESIKKDELQDLIDSIIEIKDLEIEKQTVSANVDLYIKSLNTLSMSLSTNSITFEDYSLVEDMEKLSAVEINISSSLPYSLNAYLETPIINSDNTSTIEPNILNIKESSNSSYQAFKNVSEKIILNDDCESGNDNLHNIDIKLAKDTMNKADVYKATIKFEAIQK